MNEARQILPTLLNKNPLPSSKLWRKVIIVVINNNNKDEEYEKEKGLKLQHPY